jgi:hypothetical protein
MIFGLSLAVLIGDALVMRSQLVGAVGKGLGADVLKLAPELEPDLLPELVTLREAPGAGYGRAPGRSSGSPRLRPARSARRVLAERPGVCSTCSRTPTIM